VPDEPSENPGAVDRELVVPIRSEADVVSARQGSREIATALGFGPSDQALIATAVSELARNILMYAGLGEIRVVKRSSNGRLGIVVIASDKGPGIPDVDAAMRDGYTTSGGLGLGLPGAKRLMGDLVIETGSTGTTITAVKLLDSSG
jgi:serine/threonine-protein kinase RsbT